MADNFLFLDFSKILDDFRHVRAIRRKRLLASSCLSVCPPASLSACISSARSGRNLVKFDVGDFYGTISRHSRFWLTLSQLT